MTRKNKAKTYDISRLTTVPAGMASEAARFIQKGEIVQQLPFWMEMKPKDQEILSEEIQALAAAKVMHTAGGLAMGKHLRNIKATLKPYSGAFERVAESLNINPRTAYRYLDAYVHAERAFPDKILVAAVSMGLDVISYNSAKPLGKYTEDVKQLPPPSDPNDADALRYVQNLKQAYKDRRSAIRKGLIEETEQTEEDAILKSPEFLLKASFRGVKNALGAVPARQRKRWLERLFGMVLTYQGVGNAMSFEPEAIPEEFNQGPGRPRLHENPRMVHEAVA